MTTLKGFERSFSRGNRTARAPRHRRQPRRGRGVGAVAWLGVWLVLGLGGAAAGQAQSLEFALGVGGTEGVEGFGIAVDGSGGVFVTGELRGTADFDPGPGTTTLTSNGDRDLFVARYAASTGSFDWAFGVGGSSDDEGNGIAVDGAGSVFVTGDFDDTVDFDPGPGTTTLTSNGDGDIFVARYDAATGSLDWVSGAGSTQGDNAEGIALDGAGGSSSREASTMAQWISIRDQGCSTSSTTADWTTFL